MTVELSEYGVRQKLAEKHAMDLLEALETAAVHIASIGYPVDANGNYKKGGEWTFDEAVPRAVDAAEVKAAYLTIRAAIAKATGVSP